MKRGVVLLSAIVFTMGLALIGYGVPDASAQAKKEIEIYANPLGTSGYVLSFALADMINKNSKLLHATCIETKSTTVNVMTLAKYPEKRKNAVIYSSPYTNLRAQWAQPPFKKPYSGLKWIGKTIMVGIAFITADENIKKPQDMIGKRIGVGPKGATIEFGPAAVLKAWGIFDKVKISNLSWGPGKTAFIDGTIDVGILAAVNVGEGKWKANPAGAEIMASPKPVHFINQDEAVCRKAREASGYPIFAWEIPANGLGPKQPAPLWTQAQLISWYVDEAMDDETAYEISRILWENADKFREHHATGRGINPENIHMVPELTEKDLHPGALKFAKEKGLQIGLAR